MEATKRSAILKKMKLVDEKIVEAKLHELQQRLDNHYGSQISGLNNTIATQAAKINQLSLQNKLQTEKVARLERSNATMTSMNQSFIAKEKEQRRINTEQAQKIDQQAKVISEQSTRLEEQAHKIEEQAQIIAEQSKKIGNLEQEISEMKVEREEGNAKMDNMQRQIDMLMAHFSSVGKPQQ